MSRIGKSVITVPENIRIEVKDNNLIVAKGPKGELEQQVDIDFTIKIDMGELTLGRPTEQKRHKSLHGLYNSLVRNLVQGVSVGYVKELELVGVGFRATNTGNLLELALGYSHPIMFYVPEEVKLETEMQKGKNPIVRLSGIDKQLVGQVAAKIRACRKPEPD